LAIFEETLYLDPDAVVQENVFGASVQVQLDPPENVHDSSPLADQTYVSFVPSVLSMI